MVTLGELVLRRRLETQELRGGMGLAYVPGQRHATVTNDDAILSYVDSGGWAIQMFCTFRDDEWGLKTDIFLAVNPYGIEARRLPTSTRLNEELVRTIEVARKKRAPREREAHSSPPE